MRRLWSYRSDAPIRGMRLAREPRILLIWDAQNDLTWISQTGTAVARWAAPAPVTSADFADDGSAVVAVGSQGQVWFLAPDLKPRWQRDIPGKALAVALAPFAGLLAVSNSSGAIFLIDNDGRDIAKTVNPRPLLHLVFIPERPLLVGSADYGSVAGYSLTGKRRWHDSPVAHCGSLATTGDGLLISLACFSDGLSNYDIRGEKHLNGPQPGPCRLVSLAYDGSAVLTAGLLGVVRLHDRAGRLRAEYQPELTVTAIALDALGTMAFLGMSDGTVLALAVEG